MNFMFMITIIFKPVSKTLSFVLARSNIESMNGNAAITVAFV